MPKDKNFYDFREIKYPENNDSGNFLMFDTSTTGLIWAQAAMKVWEASKQKNYVLGVDDPDNGKSAIAGQYQKLVYFTNTGDMYA